MAPRRGAPAASVVAPPPPPSNPIDDLDALVSNLQAVVKAVRLRDNSQREHVQQLENAVAAKDVRIQQLEELVTEANARDMRSRSIYEEFERRLGDEQKRWAERHAAVAAASAQKAQPEVQQPSASVQKNAAQRRPGAKAQRLDGSARGEGQNTTGEQPLASPGGTRKSEGAIVPLRSTSTTSSTMPTPTAKTPPPKAISGALDAAATATRTGPRQGLMMLTEASAPAASAPAGSTPPAKASAGTASSASFSAGRETVLTTVATPRGASNQQPRAAFPGGSPTVTGAVRTPRSMSKPPSVASPPPPPPPLVSNATSATSSPSPSLPPPPIATPPPATSASGTPGSARHATSTATVNSARGPGPTPSVSNMGLTSGPPSSNAAHTSSQGQGTLFDK